MKAVLIVDVFIYGLKKGDIIDIIGEGFDENTVEADWYPKGILFKEIKTFIINDEFIIP